jgi:hypothetical protein
VQGEAGAFPLEEQVVIYREQLGTLSVTSSTNWTEIYYKWTKFGSFGDF